MTTTYRHELSAAHARIASLEAALADKPKPPASTTTSTTAASVDQPSENPSEDAKPPPLPGVRFWHAWPLAALAALIIAFATVGGSIDGFDYVKEVVAFGIASAIVMTLRFMLQVASDGRSTMAQRILFVLGIAIGLPFILPAGLGVLQVGSVVLGIVSCVAMLIGGVVAVFKWIGTGSSE